MQSTSSLPKHRATNSTQPENLRKGTLMKHALEFAFQRASGSPLDPKDQQWILPMYFCLRAQDEFIKNANDARVIDVISTISGCHSKTITELVNRKTIQDIILEKGPLWLRIEDFYLMKSRN